MQDKINILEAMAANKPLEEVGNLCRNKEVEFIYFACCNTGYKYADELLAGLSGVEVKKLLLYRISLLEKEKAKDLIKQYIENYGLDTEIEKYCFFSREVG